MITNGSIRYDVLGDTVVEGRNYHVFREVTRSADGTVLFTLRKPLRYDSSTARVLWFSGYEYESAWTPCPFDAEFFSVVDCRVDAQYFTEGGYNGQLVFNGVAGPDTVRDLSWKRYTANSAYEIIEYYGGIGIGRYAGKVNLLALTYARVGDSEYGVPLYPVPIEPSPSAQRVIGLRVFPNPSPGPLHVDVEIEGRAVPEAGRGARVVVVDVLGREVAVLFEGTLAAGAMRLSLDAGALPAGFYVVRAGERAEVFTVVR